MNRYKELILALRMSNKSLINVIAIYGLIKYFLFPPIYLIGFHYVFLPVYSVEIHKILYL